MNDNYQILVWFPHDPTCYTQRPDRTIGPLLDVTDPWRGRITEAEQRRHDLMRAFPSAWVELITRLAGPPQHPQDCQQVFFKSAPNPSNLVFEIPTHGPDLATAWDWTER